MKIEWTQGIEALQPWASRWNALALTAPRPLPMLSLAFVGAYVEALMPPGATLHCALAHDDGELIGALPLVVRHRGAWALSVAASTPYHAHAAFGDALVDARHTHTVLPALLDAACSRRDLRLHEVALRGVAGTSATAALLQWSTGLRATAVDTHRGWGSFLPVERSWDAYRQGLSRNFRANLRKAHNRVCDAGEARYLFLRGADAAVQNLDHFLALEASGWKGQAGSAIAGHANLRRFYAALCAGAFELGTLEWHFLSLDGQRIAAHLALRSGRTLSLLKIAYDEDHARFSPGSLLFEATAERAFALGDTDEIDCLTDMPWHRPWNMQRREYFDVRLFPATWLGHGLGLGRRRLIDRLNRTAEAHPSLARIRARLQGLLGN